MSEGAAKIKETQGIRYATPEEISGFISPDSAPERERTSVRQKVMVVLFARSSEGKNPVISKEEIEDLVSDGEGYVTTKVLAVNQVVGLRGFWLQRNVAGNTIHPISYHLLRAVEGSVPKGQISEMMEFINGKVLHVVEKVKKAEKPKEVKIIEASSEELRIEVERLSTRVEVLESRMLAPESLYEKLDAVEAIATVLRRRVEELVSGLVRFFGRPMAEMIFEGRGFGRSVIPVSDEDDTDDVSDDKQGAKGSADLALTTLEIVRKNAKKFGPTRSRIYRIASHLWQAKDNTLKKDTIGLTLSGAVDAQNGRVNVSRKISDKEIKECDLVLAKMGLRIEECGQDSDSLRIVRIGSSEPTKKTTSDVKKTREYPKKSDGLESKPSSKVALEFHCSEIFRINTAESSLLLDLAGQYDKGVKAGLLLSQIAMGSSNSIDKFESVIIPRLNEEISKAGFSILLEGEGKKRTVRLVDIDKEQD